MLDSISGSLGICVRISDLPHTDSSEMSHKQTDFPVLNYLKRFIRGELSPSDNTHMRYPTAISQSLGFRIVAVEEAEATLEFAADISKHGNQQGTLHGGMLCELADATIGTAHSTLMLEGESFASIDLKATFLRPVWNAKLTARAHAIHRGKTVSHYVCDITREDGKVVATISSAVMTLRNDSSSGR